MTDELLYKRATLSRNGWTAIPLEEIDGYGLDLMTRSPHYWWKHKDGRIAYVKNINEAYAASVMTSSYLARKAGLAWPCEEVFRYKDVCGPGYISVSPLLGQKQQHFAAFRDSSWSSGAASQVMDSLSFALPFANFVGHYDLHDENVIVASWPDANGSTRYGTYIIDFCLLRPRASNKVVDEWVDRYNGGFRLNPQMIDLGYSAVRRISNRDIDDAISLAFDFTHPDKMRYGAMLPEKETARMFRTRRKALLRAHALFSLDGFKTAANSLLKRNKSPLLPPPQAPVFSLAAQQL